MRYLSVCSGIEAATVAWHPLGWEPAAFSEIEKFPRAVLQHHYPHVPLHGDFTTIKGDEYGAVDLLVGGTPCQSFSVAGLRKGLADPRGNLMLEYGALAKRLGAKWLVWENVPGVLSANGGRDFGTFLGMLAELGYGFAYRVLDAQYFGLAQRRRRVFVVGCLGDWRSAAAVLFEQHSLQGNSAPRRKAGEDFTHETAPCLTSSGRGVERTSDTRGQDPVIAVPHVDTMPTLRAGGANGGAAHGARSGDSKDEYIVPVAFAQNSRDEVRYINGDGSIAGALAAEAGMKQQTYVAFGASKADKHESTTYVAQAVGWSEELTASVELAGTLQRGGDGGRHDGVMTPSMQVRRLTPEEYEALQGFPRSYTDIKPNGKPTADGPRYKALGNSMAVPCMRWIGERIKAVDGIGK